MSAASGYPDFYVVGTPKGGTTSLFRYLESHPEVFVPQIKEPHFFACPEVKDTYYKTTFVDNQKEYLALYGEADQFEVSGDLSTSYLYNENSAQRIFEVRPDAKIVVVLRNPTDRAISHYLMDQNLGYVHAPLSEIINNPTQYQDKYHQYISTGLYQQQLKRYYDLFPSEQLHIILSDDLFADPQGTLKSLFQFLGVKEDAPMDTDQKFNQYKAPRFSFIKRLTRSESLVGLANRLPAGLRNTIKRLAFNSREEKPTFEAEKQQLRALYTKSIEQTAALIQHNLDGWK